MRILVDMTETALHGYHTGIQRVVRNVILRLPGLSAGLGTELLPVVALGARLYQVLEPLAATAVRPAPAPGTPAAGGGSRTPFRQTLRQALERLPGAPLLLRPWRRHRLYQSLRSLELALLTPRQDDLYLLLDSFWGRSTVVEAFTAFHRRGGRTVAVFYDLIPLTHPQFCGERVVADFRRDSPKVLGQADAVLAISATVAQQVGAYAAQAVPGWNQRPRPVEHFYLGADFAAGAGADGTGQGWSGWPSGLWGAGPVFLMLGTLEPRKGHALVLEAFERRWQAGSQEVLLFVGRLDGEMLQVRERMARAAQLKRPFCHLATVPDLALAEAIRRSRAGIVASCVEGFGLPLVEFMQQGLPVLASDIPVFREVGAGYPVYFPLTGPEGLGAALDEFYRREAEIRRQLTGFRWLSWDEAAETLLRRVLALGARAR